MPLDTRRWFDRTQPQTLQIATWLMYFAGGFDLLYFIGNDNWPAVARVTKGALGAIVALVVIASYIGGAFLMANERKLGYYFALFAGFSPFLLRFWIYSGTGVTMSDKITGGNLIGFIFEAALCALLLHPQSRDYQRIWFQ